MRAWSQALGSLNVLLVRFSLTSVTCSQLRMQAPHSSNSMRAIETEKKKKKKKITIIMMMMMMIIIVIITMMIIIKNSNSEYSTSNKIIIGIVCFPARDGLCICRTSLVSPEQPVLCRPVRPSM